MRIESAMYASKEGLDAHGQAISVIGDNIANAETVGYKSSRAEFSDILMASANTPETIPYTGSGSTLQRVRPIQESGIIEDTGRTLDMAVDGKGFFMVGDAAAPKYSRAGNFQISSDGFLETGGGDQVLGFTGTATALGPIDMVHVNVSGAATTAVQVSGNVSSTAEETIVPQAPANFRELGAAASYTAAFDVYDSLGAAHSVALYYFKTGMGAWTAQAYVDDAATGGTAGTPRLIGQTTLAFDSAGQITGAAAMNAQVTFQGAAASNFTVDLTKMTQYASQSGLSNVTRDGQTAGSIQGYSIKQDGTIVADLGGGSMVTVGKIQLGTVQNVDGLDRAGSTLFSATTRSGTASSGNPGENGFGKIRGGALERSTVDIAKEFVSLVLVQRGYQANAQVLNSTNDLLKEAIGMLR